MINQQGISDLFNNNPAASAPRFLVFAPQSSERLHFVCRFIFNRVLNCHCTITEQLTDLNTPGVFVINYSNQALPNTFQLWPEGLLQETSIREQKPALTVVQNRPYLFEHSHNQSPLPFDVFSAVFYFISRYEEWQSYQADAHGRFEAAASLAFQHQLHERPLVDEWIMALAQSLQSVYPNINFPPKTFQVLSTIDVDNLFAFKHKSLWRSIGASLRDAGKFNFKNMVLRAKVLSGAHADPFDIYQATSAFCQQQHIPLIYFFLYRSGTKFDRTVETNSLAFKSVFEVLKSNQAFFGLHPSYNSAYQSGLLEEEYKKSCGASQSNIIASRQHYLRYNIRQLPQRLIGLGIRYDFTMGWASVPGFRAGTAYPFYHYHFDSEKTLDLLHVPFCAMDGAYLNYQHQSAETAYHSMLGLAEKIKITGGYFVTVFHESTISDHLYKGFGTLYKNLHLALKETGKNEN
ncbi:MAG: hypothetical protein IT236_02735 [Bacteroidia bacterium]|nr:hypothetical protein [Bacteroidia bacterium]